jgi:UDP-glucose 4-epimerase
MAERKILIIGGCGFIGVNLAQYLLDRTDKKINILDNLSTGSFNNLKRIKNYSAERISFFKGDIRKKEDIQKAIKGCYWAINLAAQTGVEQSLINPVIGAQINVLGVINLLEVCKNNRVERFIQASSGACLGQQKMPVDEKKVPNPLSPYGASKLAGEGYCSAYSGSFGLKTIVLRFSNVYGPFSNLKESAVHKFIKQIFKKSPVVIYGNGKQTRDFIYIKDICKAIFLSLKNKTENNFELFQIGSGKETSINDVFELIKKEFEKRGYIVKKPVFKPARKGEVKRNFTKISKAKKALSFYPSIGIKEGIAKTIEWYKQNYKA